MLRQRSNGSAGLIFCGNPISKNDRKTKLVCGNARIFPAFGHHKSWWKLRGRSHIRHCMHFDPVVGTLKPHLSVSIIGAYIPAYIHERTRQHARETSLPDAPWGACWTLGRPGRSSRPARPYGNCRRGVGVVTRCCNLRGHRACSRVSQDPRAERPDGLPPEITVTGFFF